MTKQTRFVRDDVYEDMASSYQCVQVSMLDDALRENGVTDAAVRRSIAEAFLFNLGYFHDTGWLKPTADSPPVFPLMCFGEQFLNADSSIEELGTVFAPAENHAFHEYAMGNAALLYEGDPNAIVEIGDVNDNE